MWLIAQMQSMSKTKLSCHDRLDQVRSMMKRRQENEMTERTGVIYIENEIEKLWSIELGTICD